MPVKGRRGLVEAAETLTLEQQRALAAAQAQEALARAAAVEGTNPDYLSGVTLFPGGAAPTGQTINDAISRAVSRPAAQPAANAGPSFRFPPTGEGEEPGFGFAKPIEKPRIYNYYFNQPAITPQESAILREKIARLTGTPSPISQRAAGFDTSGLPSVRLADEPQIGGLFSPSDPIVRDFNSRPTITLADEPQFDPGLPPPNRPIPMLGQNEIDYVPQPDPPRASVDQGDATRQQAAADAAKAAQKAQGAEGDSKIEPSGGETGGKPAAPKKSYAPSAILSRMAGAVKPSKTLMNYGLPLAREVAATAVLGAGAAYAPSVIARLAREYGPSAGKWLYESWVPPEGQAAPQSQAAPQPAADPGYIPQQQPAGQSGPRPQYLENLRRSRYQIGDPNSSDIIRSLTQSRGMA
jgi:hypothetical protein